MLTNTPQCDYITLSLFTPEKLRWIEKLRNTYIMGKTVESKVRRYQGTTRGNIFAGEGVQNHVPHWIVQSSGEESENWFNLLVRENIICKVTRMDLQVTTLLPDGYDSDRIRDYCESIYPDSTDHYRSRKGMHTVYIGSRTSPRVWRVYVKEAGLQGDVRKYLRWEVECKREVAQGLYGFAVSNQEASKLLFASELLRFHKRWGDIPYLDEIMPHAIGGVIPTPREVTESRITRWLHKVVSRSLSKYVNDHQNSPAVREWLADQVALYGGRVEWH